MVVPPLSRSPGCRSPGKGAGRDRGGRVDARARDSAAIYRFDTSRRRARIRDASEAGCAPRRGVVVRVAPDPLETDAGCTRSVRQRAARSRQSRRVPIFAATVTANGREGLRKPSAPRQDEALVGALRRHGGGRRPRGAAVVVAPPPGPNPTPATTSQHPTVGPEPTWTVDEAIDEIGFGPSSS